MTAATDFYIPSFWRFRQATLLLAAHFVAVSLIQAPVSMAQSASNTSGSGENQPQQQCPQSNSSETQSGSSDGNFLQRLTRFYKADWTGKLPSTPTPERRMLDAPLESPPFPNSDWGYGGSSAIGVPDGNTYPLMTALGKEHSRDKLYGWAAASVNASTSSNNNFPLSYDIFPNRVEMNQAVIYAERLPNTVGARSTSNGATISRPSTASTIGLRPRRDTSASSCCRRTISMVSILCLSMWICTFL
jgi:hypothetical protein